MRDEDDEDQELEGEVEAVDVHQQPEIGDFDWQNGQEDKEEDLNHEVKD